MIREIVESDIPSLFRIRVATRENTMSLVELERIGITENSIRAAIKSTHRGWLYEEAGKVGGFVMGDYDEAELTVIALLPRYEKRGIGSQLLSKVETWLRSKGCQSIWLTTDVDPSLRAYGFYISHGWEDSRIENGLRYMTKKLNV
jgi:GNAT superfamily N-acetyltransferase